jgi:hypothetical protein
MREFEIYLPTRTKDGVDIDAAKIESIKSELIGAFGGYTHLNQHSEGAWKMGGVTFYDTVTILRVLDDSSAAFDLKAFKSRIAQSLEQEAVLIVSRDVRLE